MEEHKENNHTEHKKDNLTISKTMLWKTITGILGVLFILSIFTNGFGIRGSDSGTGAAEAQPSQAQAAQPSSDNDQQQAQTEISVEGLPFKGTEDAKVTIVEYSSFSCGFCNRARGTIDQILEEYPNDVKFVYKHFDRGGTDSMTAQAAECAGEQGKFWEMHDTIFDKGSSGDVEGYAEDIGLNVDSFTECLDSGKYVSRVSQDTSEARSLGMSGTPSFLINGQLIVGAQPFENFKQIIDAELAE